MSHKRRKRSLNELISDPEEAPSKRQKLTVTQLNPIQPQLAEIEPTKNKKTDENQENERKSNDKTVKCSKCEQDTSAVNIEFCVECGAECGCKEECCFDHGDCCSQCEEFMCHNCGRFEMCGECLEMQCNDCGDFKPGKGGTTQCSRCQPWWKKNKPASDFCVGCGSSRSNANFCNVCGDRYCKECPGFICCECMEFECEVCSEMQFCKECAQCFCDDCGGHEC